MASDSQTSSPNDEDPSTRFAFNFLLGALGFALLSGLWMLIQTAFL
ncbi:MAG: hypothetical protein ABEL51_14830 [Salinibacter sp.]